MFVLGADSCGGCAVLDGEFERVLGTLPVRRNPARHAP